MKQTIIFLVAALLGQALIAVEPVSIDIQADWEKAIADSEGVVVENGAKELYDHRNDPDEFRNLANAPAHKKIHNELSRWLPQNAASEFKSKSERVRVRR